MNRSDPKVRNRKLLWRSAVFGLALALALGAFFALRGRVTPLWVADHPARATTP